MGWFGKIAGGAVGLLIGGPLGAILGAVLGHAIFNKRQAGLKEYRPFSTSSPSCTESVVRWRGDGKSLRNLGEHRSR